jgi:glycosyltransferase involved in cell wall biosynthesis
MMVSPELTIVVLAFNEEETLTSTVGEILAACGELDVPFEVVVVDDGSNDGTAEIARQLMDDHLGLVRLVTHERNEGMGVAIRTGLLSAHGKWVGVLPGDGQFDPADMVRMFRSRDGYDVVIGTVRAHNRLSSDNLLRLILSWGMRITMRLFHPRIPSFNGVLIARRDLIEVSRLVCRTGFVHMEILDRGRLRQPRMRIASVPIVVRPRRAGQSKVANLTTILHLLGDMVNLRISYLRDT